MMARRFMPYSPEQQQAAVQQVRSAATRFRRRERGANLAILCAVAALIIGFMGITIYTGLQAFIESDLQRASMNAALAGAAAYYSGTGTAGKPTPNSGNATGIATSTFSTIAGNSSLGGFGSAISSTTSNDSTDSITVTAKSVIPTAFLAPIGIKQIEVNASSTARALRYEPTLFTGPIEITPDGADILTYSRVLDLAFPLVDGPGTDLYVEQPAETQQGVFVEACNEQECYSLMEGATPVGTSQILTSNGVKLLYGTATFDLTKAGVRKATKLRFTHGNDFDNGYYNAGAATPYDAELPLTIKRVMLFGYAGACVDDKQCAIPAGFAPVN